MTAEKKAHTRRCSQHHAFSPWPSAV